MKTPIPIALAVEDELSELILRRLLEGRSQAYVIGPVFRKGGFGYLKKQCAAFNNMAKACPVLLLTDLDQGECAPSLRNEWLKQPQQRHFLLRVAVREVEAWLLASDNDLKTFLGVRSKWSISSPESLPDPKAVLLKIAIESSKRDIRDAITKKDSGGNLKQGPAYNSTLAKFVNDHWCPDVAEAKCPSFKKLVNALSALEASWK